ncbi:MAG: low-specificity L-threonine aldolase [Peptostreptococcaceae bacterium]|nr:low-specificity L-threonine aldolase [Peptostreptococcaceae bacterium]
MRYIDLRSDTVTQPTKSMREAMYIAEVGDDVYQDDPTVNELEALAAKMLGKESAMFVPSGTMSNQLALMCFTNRGEEIIVSADCHIFAHEVGAAAVLSGANLRQLSFEKGIYDVKMIEKAIRSDDIHEPRTALICMENALANGNVFSIEIMEEVYALAQKNGIAVHLDGARVFNAATALDVDVKELTKNCDTVSCCLSKGLCAPVGSILAGDTKVIANARKYRKMLGGGMRQSGILAAAGIISLKDMTKRLKEDHDNAKYMAKKLSELAGVEVDLDSVCINMVFFKLNRPEELIDSLPEKMLENGIKINGCELGEFRFVTSNDVSRDDIDYAISTFSKFIV